MIQYRNIDHWVLLVRRKLHLKLVFTKYTVHVIGTEKSSGKAHLSNIWTKESMDRTSGQPQVKLSLLRSICLKIRPLYIAICTRSIIFHIFSYYFVLYISRPVFFVMLSPLFLKRETLLNQYTYIPFLFQNILCLCFFFLLFLLNFSFLHKYR